MSRLDNKLYRELEAGGLVDVTTDSAPATDVAVTLVTAGHETELTALELTAREALELGLALILATDTRTSERLAPALEAWDQLGTVVLKVDRWVRPIAGTVCGDVEVLPPDRVTIAPAPVSPITGRR